jgi:uncharacterized protein HemY
VRALELARQHDERANQAYVLRVLGAVAEHCGQWDQAEEHFRASLQQATELGMRPLQVQCHLGLFGPLKARSHAVAAAEHQAAAAAMANAMQMHVWRNRLESTVRGA